MQADAAGDRVTAWRTLTQQLLAQLGRNDPLPPVGSEGPSRDPWIGVRRFWHGLREDFQAYINQWLHASLRARAPNSAVRLTEEGACAWKAVDKRMPLPAKLISVLPTLTPHADLPQFLRDRDGGVEHMRAVLGSLCRHGDEMPTPDALERMGVMLVDNSDQTLTAAPATGVSGMGVQEFVPDSPVYHLMSSVNVGGGACQWPPITTTSLRLKRLKRLFTWWIMRVQRREWDRRIPIKEEPAGPAAAARQEEAVGGKRVRSAPQQAEPAAAADMEDEGEEEPAKFEVKRDRMPMRTGFIIQAQDASSRFIGHIVSSLMHVLLLKLMAQQKANVSEAPRDEGSIALAYATLAAIGDQWACHSMEAGLLWRLGVVPTLWPELMSPVLTRQGVSACMTAPYMKAALEPLWRRWAMDSEAQAKGSTWQGNLDVGTERGAAAAPVTVSPGDPGKFAADTLSAELRGSQNLHGLMGSTRVAGVLLRSAWETSLFGRVDGEHFVE